MPLKILDSIDSTIKHHQVIDEMRLNSYLALLSGSHKKPFSERGRGRAKKKKVIVKLKPIYNMLA